MHGEAGPAEKVARVVVAHKNNFSKFCSSWGMRRVGGGGQASSSSLAAPLSFVTGSSSSSSGAAGTTGGGPASFSVPPSGHVPLKRSFPFAPVVFPSSSSSSSSSTMATATTTTTETVKRGRVSPVDLAEQGQSPLLLLLLLLENRNWAFHCCRS